MKRATVRDLRNRFPRIAAWIALVSTLIAWILLAGVAEGGAPEGPFVLGGGSDGLALNGDGAFLGWGTRSAEDAAPERFVLQGAFSSWPSRRR
jgi:hypothetical protein